jgi:uncharacterized protein (DUF697 family)
VVVSRLRRAAINRVVPDLHKVAPNVNGNVVYRAVSLAVHGVGPLPAASVAADRQLREHDGDTEQAVHGVIENHVRLAASQGFVTNLGGIVTLAATIPVNITGLALLQCRMVAAIAHLRGYDLTDPRVRNALLLCVLGEESVTSLVRSKKLPGGPMTVATAPAHDPELDTLIAAEVTSALVGRVIGKRAGTAIVRRIPLAGGAFGAGSDAYSTWQVGRYADRELRPRPVTRLVKDA